ncbi:RmlC-like cupin domain-containing protein [Bisporella sp. PMI_857]|nr:RmlC-like cupin domain-containing protein [Bisporella sp. PMI_857]
MASLKPLSTPPGQNSEPYVLKCFEGELWTIPTSNSVMRLLVTGKETNNAFAVVGTGGTFDKPIGFHYHKEAHDVFLCLKGRLNIWADDSARILEPGDFASVPPGTIHQYQIASAHTEFIGLIIPGGWEEFFRFIGEPFSGPLFPTHDRRNPFEVLIPRLIAATEKFDMIPVREKQAFDPQPWTGSENTLPGKCERGGYFLKADTGPRWQLGGTVIKPLATRKETDGRFSIYSWESSVNYVSNGLNKSLNFSETHHAIQVIEGVVAVAISGEESKILPGETVFVPSGTGWKINAESVFAKVYIFANGGGLGEVSQRVGQQYEFAVVPEESDIKSWKVEDLNGLQQDLKFTVVA